MNALGKDPMMLFRRDVLVYHNYRDSDRVLIMRRSPTFSPKQEKLLVLWYVIDEALKFEVDVHLKFFS